MAPWSTDLQILLAADLEDVVHPAGSDAAAPLRALGFIAILCNGGIVARASSALRHAVVRDPRHRLLVMHQAALVLVAVARAVGAKPLRPLDWRGTSIFDPP